MDNILETLPKLFSEAFIKSAKKNLQIDESSILSNTSTIVGKIILVGFNNFIPSVVGVVLESLTTNSDSELKQMSKQLSKVIREPFLTGIDQLKTSLETQPTNESEINFQQQRLLTALQNFDKALQLCEEDEKVQIKFLQGVTLLKINGGTQEAKSRLREFIDSATSKKKRLEGELRKLQHSVNTKRNEAQSIVATEPKAGGGLIGFSGSSDYFKKMELLNTANKMGSQCERTIDSIQDLNKIIATTTITYNLLI